MDFFTAWINHFRTKSARWIELFKRTAPVQNLSLFFQQNYENRLVKLLVFLMSKRKRIFLPLLSIILMIIIYFLIFKRTNSQEKPVYDGPDNYLIKEAVQKAMVDSWEAYKLYAWGKDEVHPLSHSHSFILGTAVTMVDALDTLWIMDLKKEFYEAQRYIATNLTFTSDQSVSIFEIVIRVLGGLMSAYDLSKEEVFLVKALELGHLILPAYYTMSGIPPMRIRLKTTTKHFFHKNYSSLLDVQSLQMNCSQLTGHSIEKQSKLNYFQYYFGHITKSFKSEGQYSTLADVGTVQLEFSELSRISGQPHFKVTGDNIIKIIRALPKPHGLPPSLISSETGCFREDTPITFGGTGDSYYEYLLKVWVHGGKKDIELRRDYIQAIEGLKKHLLHRSKPSNLLYVATLNNGNVVNRMEHLTCFLPATLAYGTLHGMPKDHLEIAKELMKTCYEMYRRMPTGLSADTVQFTNVNTSFKDFKPLDVFNVQRPETVESLFYLYRVTKNSMYQDWGWEIFTAFDRYAKVQPYGYVGVNDVTNKLNVGQMTKCESFWYAETLKYFYLLFSEDPYLFPLTEYVFNTEAHPFPIPPYSKMKNFKHK